MSVSKNTLALLNAPDEISDLGDMNFDRVCPYSRGMDVPDKWGVFDRCDFVVLSGYPSCGKTEFTYFLSRQNADRGVKVLYLSLELPPQKLLERLARKRGGVSKKAFQERTYSPEQRDIMNNAYLGFKNYKNVKLMGYESSPTIETIVQTIETHHEQGYSLFFIDNLGKIAGDQNEVIRFTDISGKLQSLKNKLDTCIVLLHHMKKPQFGSEYKPGGLAGIRGCQKLTDDATMVLELWRDLDPDRSEDETTLTLLKDTMDGATGILPLVFNRGDYATRVPNGGAGALPVNKLVAKNTEPKVQKKIGDVMMDLLGDTEDADDGLGR